MQGCRRYKKTDFEEKMKNFCPLLYTGHKLQYSVTIILQNLYRCIPIHRTYFKV